jgi:MYXO-CTERM domain-containing protein
MTSPVRPRFETSPRHPLSAALLVALGSAASSCVEESAPLDDDEVLASSQPIVNGQVDTGHPATVALTVQGYAFCSGTLVTPTVVVTAAHCITPEIGSPSWEQVEVFFGTSVFEGGTFIALDDGLAHPGFDATLEDPDDDIAVLRLDSPAPVAPVPMADLPPLGTSLTLVGFGITQTGAEDGGTKRVASATIFERYGKVFAMELAPSGTCSGDSGGTALWNDGGVEKLVGVHTRSDCASFMLNESVDSHLADFVQPFIDAGASCGGDGACATGCSSPDPDCPCAADGFCTVACADVASDPDCDPLCAAEGTCVQGCPMPDSDCPTCADDGECNPDCDQDPDCEVAEGGGGAGGGGADESDEEDGGCDCAATGRPASRGAWFALGLAMVVARRRRSRAPRPRR